MKKIKIICKRELMSYINSPVFSIIIVTFLMSMMGLTFIVGNLYKTDNASLEEPFFGFHPWIYLFLIPAVGMRLWAEEKREGTLEVLLTLPFTIPQLVIGKFLASWIFILAGLVLTFPVVLTLYYLGSPDLGPIMTGYFGSWLMAGAFLAIASYTSSLTKNQVISFVLSLFACLIFVLIGYGVFQVLFSNIPSGLNDFLANFGFVPHFQAMIKGVIALKDVFYFLSVIAFFLLLNVISIEKSRV